MARIAGNAIAIALREEQAPVTPSASNTGAGAPRACLASIAREA
jgi:hypothetical protein